MAKSQGEKPTSEAFYKGIQVGHMVWIFLETRGVNQESGFTFKKGVVEKILGDYYFIRIQNGVLGCFHKTQIEPLGIQDRK